jgi:Zn-dependent peptidase ImmA (M78 family)
MTTPIQAIINPALLVWARSSAGFELDVAAKKMSVPTSKLIAAERGDAHLTVKQLIKAAAVYKRPFAAFYLQQPPVENDIATHDYRRTSGARALPLSSSLRFALRNARLRRRDAAFLAEELGESPIEFNLSTTLSNDSIETAKKLREWLSVSDEDQLKWRGPRNALKSWKRRLEERNILIFETSGIAIQEMRGFSIFASIFPTIVLNGSDSPAGRIFTLMHELTHLALNQDGLCDTSENESPISLDDRVEVFCNRVAGEAVAPASLLDSVLPSNIAPNGWTHEILLSAAIRLSTSREVILRRLLALGRTTQAHYRRLRQEFQAEYDEQREKRKATEGGPSYYVIHYRNLGMPFVKLVFDAYSQEKISLSSVSDYLGVKLNNLEEFYSHVQSESAL